MLAAALPLLLLLASARCGAPLGSTGAQEYRTKLQPEHYRSLSGTYELYVDPATPRGDGPAACELRRDGELVWKRELGYSFQQAAVAEDGSCIGCAYSEGFYDPTGRGALVIALLSPRGELRYEDVQPRAQSSMLHGNALPRVRGVLVQDVARKGIVRLIAAAADGSGEEEAWWVYDLDAVVAKDVKRVCQPQAALDPNVLSRWETAALALQDRPLVLVSWRETGGPLMRHGLRYSLLDEQLQPIWELDLPRDLVGLTGTSWERALSSGASLSVRPGGELCVSSFAERTRIRLLAERDPDAPSRWSVRELGREAWSLQGEPEVAIPALELRCLGRTRIEHEESEPEPIRDVLSFAFTEEGSIRFVRDDSASPTLVQLDREGRVLRETAVRAPLRGLHGGEWAALGPLDWLCVAPRNAERSDVYRVHGEDGRVERVAKPSVAFPCDLAVASDGRFALLDEGRDVVHLFDARGDPIWRSDGEPALEPGLAKARDIAFRADGLLMVLTRSELVRISAAGRVLERIDLTALLGVEPAQADRIAAAPDGGLLLEDELGAPSLWRISASGRVLGGFSPDDPEERTAGALARRALLAPDGRVWTTDGRVFAELGEDGRILRILGKVLWPERLHEASSTRIDALGRLLVEDRSTCNVHVLDASGVRLLLCRLAREDRGDLHGIGRLCSTADGGVLVERDYRNTVYLRFDALGARLGEHEFGAECLAWVPGSRECWGVKEGVLVRLDASGVVVSEIRRRPDRRYLEDVRDLAVAPDGSLAVLEQDALLLYDREGRPIETIGLPAARSNLAYCGAWAAIADWGAEVLLVETATGELQRFTTLTEERGAAHAYGFSPDGTELWDLQRKPLELRRFELP